MITKKRKSSELSLAPEDELKARLEYSLNKAGFSRPDCELNQERIVNEIRKKLSADKPEELKRRLAWVHKIGTGGLVFEHMGIEYLNYFIAYRAVLEGMTKE